MEKLGLKEQIKNKMNEVISDDYLYRFSFTTDEECVNYISRVILSSCRFFWIIINNCQKIKADQLQNQLGFLGLKRLIDCKTNYRVLYDNRYGEVLKEYLDYNEIMFPSPELLSSNRLLYCERPYLPYFEDYIKTFINKLDLKLVIVDDFNLVNYNENDFYFFMTKVPQIALLNDRVKAIYINMEQLTRESYMVYYSTIYKYKIPIIDYSDGNHTLTKTSKLLRYQYMPEEVSKLSVPYDKIYDVAFVGTLSPRRNFILNQLRNKGIKVIEANGWQDKRDMEIMKAKILLNIHYDNEYNVYESIRCDRFIFSGMLVISETSVFQDCIDINDLIISENYSDLVSKVLEVIQNYPMYLKEFLSKKKVRLPWIVESRKRDLVGINTMIESYKR
jgi:hypothetical protein